MSRTMARLFLVSLLFGAGCDISARTRAGAILVMSMQGVDELPAGQHLELWASLSTNDTVRIDSIYDTSGPDPANPGKQKAFHSFYGLTLRRAITMADPCMIDSTGNLLITAAAYPPEGQTINGVFQSAEELAAQTRARIAQLVTDRVCDDATPPHCGHQFKNLIAVLPFDPTPVPVIQSNAPAAERLAACQQYWNASPISYTPNPIQINAPIHGTAFGFVDFITQTPATAYDQVRLDTPLRLNDIQQLWMTVEGDTVDPKNQGPVFLSGRPDEGGRDIVHIDLSPPFGSTNSAAAQVALNVSLDEDPVQF